MSANPRDHIEPLALDYQLATDARGHRLSRVYEKEIELSKAISLKRIADALEAGVIDAQKRGH
jgi:hypothetical protein